MSLKSAMKDAMGDLRLGIGGSLESLLPNRRTKPVVEAAKEKPLAYAGPQVHLVNSIPSEFLAHAKRNGHESHSKLTEKELLEYVYNNGEAD